MGKNTNDYLPWLLFVCIRVIRGQKYCGRDGRAPFLLSAPAALREVLAVVARPAHIVRSRWVAVDRFAFCCNAVAIRSMSTTKILSILEAANIEPPKARAIAESLEIAFHEQEEDLTKRLLTKQDGAEVKAEIIKWMFLFWIGQTAATAAIVKFLLS